MLYRIYKTKDNAEAQLDSNIGASATTIIVKPGEGALFPQPYNGTTTSGGSSTVMNKTGIGASGVAVGDYIENATDGSSAFVLAVNTDSLTTTELQNGSDNTWQNGDSYVVNPFVATINSRNADGAILSSEKVKIIGRSTDSLTVATGGRGFASSTAQSWVADDYLNVFSIAASHDEYRKAFADLCRQLDLKASILYVQGLLASRNWKDPVLVATTTNGTLATAYENGDTIDGVVLTTGDRILIKDQSDPKENGIYIVNASGAPTRATDFDTTAEITAGVVNVTKGTSNADTLWMCTSDSPVIGSNNIVFAQLSAALSKASQAEAQAGTDDTKFMTAAKVIDSLKVNSLIAHGGSGADGDLVVSGTITLNLNQVYNFNNVSGTGTLTFTGSGSIALINVAGNLSGNFTIELRNTSSGDPSVEYLTADGRLSGGTSAQASAPNIGGAGGTSGAGAGGAGGNSTAVGAGGAGAAGVTSNGAGGAGGGGNSTGGGGGGGGGASTANNGSAGGAASGNNGGNGGQGGASTGANPAGGGGGGGAGWNTGNGGAGANAGAATSVSTGYVIPRGGNGGASGANGGNGGPGANSGTVTVVSNTLTFTAAKGGNGGWGYSAGGAGGQGSSIIYGGALSNISGVLGAGGDGGHSTYGTGGAGGAGGDSSSTNHSSGSAPAGAAGGTGGNGRNGGAGGRGSDFAGTGNITGGNGGQGGSAKTGCSALYIAVRGNSTYNGTINGQGGTGGAGGRGGNSIGTTGNSNGGNGGDGAKGADVVIVTLGTCTTPTVNNLGGLGGAGGAPGIGGSGIAWSIPGQYGAKGKDGANGIKIIQQLLI